MKKSTPTAILVALVAALVYWLGLPNAILPPETSSTASAPPSTSPAGATHNFQGMVVGVSDGDTIKVLVGTEQVKVRFSHIDAPEKKQAFGNKANEFLSTMLSMANNQVSVVVEGQDRYGRTLGVVYTMDGTYNFNLGMVENGYAWHYVQYSTDPVYAAAQTFAQQNRLGLWADAMQPIPPWDYRKQN